MTGLARIPILLALPLFALLFAAVAVAAHSILRRKLPPPEQLSENHDVAGFLMGVVGVLYSVVLGFLVGTVWTAFASAQQTTDLEAGYVADAFNFATQLSSPDRRSLQRDIARYAVAVHDADWSSARVASGDVTAPLLYHAVRFALSAQPPRNASSAEVLETNSLRSALVESLQRLADMRRLRLVQSESRLPQGMLEALILGAAFVMSFTFLFGVRSYAKQMFMTALIAGCIGLFFGLILELSTPYSGAIQVSRDSLTFVIDNNRLREYAR